MLTGQTFTFRIAVLQKCFEIYVNENIYGTFEYMKFPKQLQYAMIYGDFEKITQFHHRMLYPLVFPKGLICPERIAFQSDVPRKYEAGFVYSDTHIRSVFLIFVYSSFFIIIKEL